jgi:hypothetical protein
MFASLAFFTPKEEPMSSFAMKLSGNKAFLEVGSV